jgi:arylsulfatase
MGKFQPDRTVLPIPDRTFGGTMGRTLDQSVGDWAMIPGPKAPEGAPNVLIVLIDDAGFGGPTTFGGAIDTPNLTRVQGMGLIYNRFHATAVCSPTRAALLTGRNHHRVGMGTVAELPGPYPGYTGTRPRSCTALPRILKENGYVTGGFGKWHLTPATRSDRAPRDTRRPGRDPRPARTRRRPDLELREAPAGAAQRDPRPVQGRGGADGP